MAKSWLVTTVFPFQFFRDTMLSLKKLFTISVAGDQKDHLILGQAILLLTRGAPNSRDLVRYVKLILRPAILLKQIQILYDEEGSPRAYFVWARLAEDVEKRVIAKGEFSLHLSEWNEGNSLWLLDVVAPHGNLKETIQYLRDVAFPLEDRVRFVREKKSGRLILEMERASLRGMFRSAPVTNALCKCGEPLTIEHAQRF